MSSTIPVRGTPPRSFSPLALAPLGAALVALLGACSHGSTKAGVTTSPLMTSSEARYGTTVSFDTFVKVPGGDGMLTIVADADGDRRTTNDQYTIRARHQVFHRQTEQVAWDTGTAPAGTYAILSILEYGHAADGTTYTKVNVLSPAFHLNSAPTVTIDSPDTVMAHVSGTVEIRYTDDDPDDDALTSVWADVDGNPDTTGDQFLISVRPDANGIQQTVQWDTAGVPADTYWIVARSEDSLPGVTEVKGPARVEFTSLFARQFGAMLPGAIHAGGEVEGNAVLALADGGSVVAGSFQDCLTMDASSVLMVTNGRRADTDAFLARLDAHGDVAWVVASRTPSNAYGNPAVVNAVAQLPGGSFAIAGSYRGSKVFGWKLLESSRAYPTAPDRTEDAFVARYGVNGAFAWATSFGGPGVDRVLGMAALPDGSVIVGGVFSDEIVLGAGEPNQTVLTSAGLFHKTRDLFLARYDGSGRLVWAHRAGGLEDDDLTGLASLSDGSFLATGSFRADANFGEGANGRILSSMGLADAFVVKYGADGQLAWAKSFGGPEDVLPYAIATFGNDDFVVVGKGNGPVDFGNGPMLGHWEDPFVARFAASGNLQWAQHVTTGGGGEATAVATTFDAFVVTGCFDGTAVFAPGCQVNAWDLAGATHHEAFFARYESDGTVAWARAGGSTGDDFGRGIAAWPDGTPLAIGPMKGDARFELGPTGCMLHCIGGQDAFLFGMDAQGLLGPAPPKGTKTNSVKVVDNLPTM